MATQSLGEKIYRQRKVKGISQEKLAELVGVSRQTIYKWESDFVQPNAENINTLCEVLGVNKDYFYNDNYDSIKNNEQNDEIALTLNEPEKTKKSIFIGLIINSIVLLLLLFTTICLGFMTISTNIGDDKATSMNINYGYFIISLCLSIVAIIGEIVMIVMYKRKK